MASERFDTTSNVTAGTNPAEVQPHISDIPYDNTSLHEAVTDEVISSEVNTGQLEAIQAGEWTERAPAKEAVIEAYTGYIPNGGEQTTTAVESKKGRGKLYAAVGATAAAAVAAASFFLLPKGESKTDTASPAPSKTVATAEAAPTYEDPSNRPADIVKHGLYNKLSVEQKNEVDRLNAMTFDEFSKEPEATQLKYAQFIYDNNIAHTKYLLTSNGLEEFKPLQNLPEPSIANTPIEITRIRQLQTETLLTLMPDKKPLDKLNATKMMPLYISQASKGLQKSVDLLTETNGGVAHINADPLPETFKKTTSPDGITSTIVNEHMNGELVQTTYVFTPFSDLDGKSRGTWRVALSVNSADPRFDSTVR